MKPNHEVPLDRLRLSGVRFDAIGLKKRRYWGRYLHRWKELRSVAIETPIHRGHLVRVLVLKFLDNSTFALPVDRGFKNAFVLESVLKLLKKVAGKYAHFSGHETVLGIRDRYLELGGSSNDDDRLMVRARVLLDALEMKRTIRLCDRLIRKQSRWEQAARTLKVRALLFCGCYIAAKNEIRLLEEFFEEEKEANAGVPLTSLNSEQPSGAWYARTLLDEYERHIVKQGVELKDLLVSRKNYDDVIDLIDSLKMKFPLEDLNLDATMDDLYREHSTRRDFSGYVLGRFRISTLMGQALLLVLLSVGIGRLLYPSVFSVPDLIDRSERILNLDYVGIRAVDVKVDPNVKDVGFGLRRVYFSFLDPTRDVAYGEVWHHGDSLVFVSEAVRILNEPEKQVVTFYPRNAGVSEVGSISYRRVFALWIVSWKEFQGALILLFVWLLVCLYYMIRRMSRT